MPDSRHRGVITLAKMVNNTSWICANRVMTGCEPCCYRPVWSCEFKSTTFKIKEKIVMSRSEFKVPYLTLGQALEKINDARAYQLKPWPSTSLVNAGGRPFEEWLVLIDVYLAKLKAVYAETPSFKGDGDEPNLEGLARIEKYAAIVANLAVWAVQSAKGAQ